MSDLSVDQILLPRELMVRLDSELDTLLFFAGICPNIQALAAAADIAFARES